MYAYNCKIYDYGCSKQLRIYSTPIKKNDEDNKSIKENFEIPTKQSSKKTDKNDSEIRSKNRSKNKVYELARANQWEWFLTFTFDRNKVDATNYDIVLKSISKWLMNCRNRKAHDLKWLIVPELHADGKHYHFHGLLANCGDMQFIDSGVVQNGKRVYNLKDYKMGFTTATKVEDTQRASAYLCKYITKDLECSLMNKHRYLASRNLDKPSVKELHLSDEEKMELMKNYDIKYIKTVNGEYMDICYIEI